MIKHIQNNGFKQGTAFMKASDQSITRMAVRVRCIFNDAGILFVSVAIKSLNANSMVRKEQNELHFWKHPLGGASNA